MTFHVEVKVRPIADQSRVGRDLLIGSVIAKGATGRTLYLPNGDWHDQWTGAAHTGGRWLTVPAPWESVPVFVRAGTAIPLPLPPGAESSADVGNATEPLHGLSWRLFPDASTSVDADGATLERDANGLRVTVPGAAVPGEVVLPDGRRTGVPAGSGQQLVRFEAG